MKTRNNIQFVIGHINDYNLDQRWSMAEGQNNPTELIFNVTESHIKDILNSIKNAIGSDQFIEMCKFVSYTDKEFYYYPNSGYEEVKLSYKGSKL